MESTNCLLMYQGHGDEVDAETEEVLNEFSFLEGREDLGVGVEKSEDWSYSAAAGRSGGSDDVSLGELAQLTVNNDADVSMDVSPVLVITNCILILQNRNLVYFEPSFFNFLNLSKLRKLHLPAVLPLVFNLLMELSSGTNFADSKVTETFNFDTKQFILFLSGHTGQGSI